MIVVMRFLAFVAGVLSIAPLASALPANKVVVARQGAAAANLYKGSGWIEMITARSNGQLLLARLDVPELWGLDPSTKAASKLLSFSGAASVTGLAEVSPDVFAVITGNFSTRGFTVKSGSWAVWKVDFTGGAPKATQVKLVPESGFFIGAAALDKDNILIADAGKGSLYRMNLGTGEYSVVLADKSMVAPAQGGLQEGIHGLKYHDGYAYFTNTFGTGFYKLKVDASGKASGTPTEVVNLATAEDFIIGADGTAYVAQPNANAVTRVTADGKTSKVASASSCSSVVFGRGEKDKNVLYIATTNGAVMSVTVE